MNTSFVGLDVVDIRSGTRAVGAVRSALDRGRRTRRLVLARRPDALLGRSRLDPDRRRDRCASTAARRASSPRPQRGDPGPGCRRPGHPALPPVRQLVRWQGAGHHRRGRRRHHRNGLQRGSVGQDRRRAFLVDPERRSTEEAGLVALSEPGTRGRSAPAVARRHRQDRTRLHDPRLPQRRQRDRRSGRDRLGVRWRVLAAVAAAGHRPLRRGHLVARFLGPLTVR